MDILEAALQWLTRKSRAKDRQAEDGAWLTTIEKVKTEASLYAKKDISEQDILCSDWSKRSAKK